MSTTVTLTGTLGQDPELRFTQAGKAVVSLSMVTSKSVKGEDGKWQDTETTWWRVTAWDQMAENCAETLQKGDPVIVVGRTFMETFEDKSGVERQSLKVSAFNVGLDLKRRSASVLRDKQPVSVKAPVGDDPWAVPVQDDIPPF
jgi:single-strand DNA-binding protein